MVEETNSNPLLTTEIDNHINSLFPADDTTTSLSFGFDLTEE